MRILLAWLLCGAAAAHAAGERAGERERAFRGFDLDGDGRISLAEAAGYEDIVLRFDKADRNRDGKLSAAEFRRLARIKVRRAARPVTAARTWRTRDHATPPRCDRNSRTASARTCGSFRASAIRPSSVWARLSNGSSSAPF